MTILKTIGKLLLEFLVVIFVVIFVFFGIPKMITYMIGDPNLYLKIYQAWGPTVIIVALTANCYRYIIIAYPNFLKKRLSFQERDDWNRASSSKSMKYITAGEMNLMKIGPGVFRLYVWGNIILSMIVIAVMIPTLMEAYFNVF